MARQTYGITHGFTDYRRMLKELPDIDAIAVCTPNYLHAEHSIAALEAGKHVLVEKPMATSVADAERMVSAARASGKQLVVGFQQRFDPRVQMIRRQIEAGALGQIVYVRAQALRRRGIPSWGSFGNKQIQGGGALVDLGVHILEAAHFLLGSPLPLSVSASTFCHIGDRPCGVEVPWGPWDHTSFNVEDLAVGMIRFAGGAALHLETCFAAHIARDICNIQVFGERGGANLDPTHLYTDVNGYMMTSSPEHLRQTDPFEYKMRHFVEVARGSRYNEVPPEHGVMVQQILQAMYISSEQRREVRLDDPQVIRAESGNVLL
jgi:predicted dehydrogenase